MPTAPRTFLLFIVLCIVAASLGACGPKVSDATVTPVAPAVVQRWVERDSGKQLLIDVRPEESYRAGHIPGAVSMSTADVNERERDPRLLRYSTLVVYGEDAGSARARAMVKRLMVAKYKDVRQLQGGYAQWTSLGLPVERGN
ncbi:MAG: rhodanese-like domain-containing protein [Planctomycetota bacterium]